MKERENIDVVYDDHCFLTYRDDGDEIVVFDIYSDKEVRGTGYMLEFCDNFYNKMREEGKKIAYGMTDMRTNGWEYSEKLLLKYGFVFIGKDSNDDCINKYYYKL